MHTHGTIAIEEGTSLAPSTTLVYDDDIETPSRVTIDMSPAPARTGSLLTVDNVEQALTRAQAEVDRLRLRKEQAHLQPPALFFSVSVIFRPPPPPAPPLSPPVAAQS